MSAEHSYSTSATLAAPREPVLFDHPAKQSAAGYYDTQWLQKKRPWLYQAFYW